jgi:RNA polymerase-binding transcription factor DksA
MEIRLRKQIAQILEEYFGLVEGNKFDNAVKGSATDQLLALFNSNLKEQMEGKKEKCNHDRQVASEYGTFRACLKCGKRL